MGFASAWLEKNALFPAFISEAPDKNTGIIVVIPAFNEPDIVSLLDSLKGCREPGCKAEILIVINAPTYASGESLINNKLCMENAESWKKANKGIFFRLFVFNTGNHGLKNWGVGLARKSGMDEALRRFDLIGNPGGAIVSLDADCTVKDNYLTEIFSRLVKHRDHKACSIYFEHPLSGIDFGNRVYRIVTLYELHMRYYLQGLIYSGFPYAVHTVGSAMACKAMQYMKAGGMNRRKAGEDFYFIQKLLPLGGHFSLNSTAVYPSPRESFRAPFGTGATITKMLAGNEEQLYTYNFASFKDLQQLFIRIRDLYQLSHRQLIQSHGDLPEGLRSFIPGSEWHNKIIEIQENTASIESFCKRFFTWFNMFRIVKYLNYLAAGFYEKQPVAEAASELLSATGSKFSTSDPLELLSIYREMETVPH